MRFLLIALLLAVSAGCRKAEDKVTVETEEGTTTVVKKGNTTVVTNVDGEKTTVQSEGQKVQIETKDGKFTTGENKVPEGFPLSLMPGSTVQQATHLAPANEPEMFQVSSLVGTEPEKAATFYENALKAKGLQVDRAESTTDQIQQFMLSGKSDKAEASVMIMKEAKADRCTAVITWTVEK